MENQEENILKNDTEVQNEKAPYPGLAVALVIVCIVVAIVVVGTLIYSCIGKFF